MPKIMAICSCPRLGYMDFMGQSIAAFAQNGVGYRNVYGAFWSQTLSNGIQTCIDEGNDYIITTDYDSIFTGDDVAQLIRLAEQNPEADAICAMQMGRFSGLLVSTDSGTLTRKELKTQPIVPVVTGHFGLTIIRASAFKDLPKPWFWSKPDSDGEWKAKSDKRDEDIYFWINFKESGRKLFVAPRIVIGHLELLIKWPDDNLEGMYETLGTYHEHGKPVDIWT